MNYNATLKKLSPTIEEEVVVEIEGIEIMGFAFLCPYKISIDSEYPVNVSFMLFDEIDIKKQEYTKKKGIEHVGEAYEYKLQGCLEGDGIDVGIIISDDEGYLEDCGIDIGEFVDLKVGRINVEFLV